MAVVKEDYVVRFDIHQRIQHLVLMVSFIVLAITGIPRGFPSWPLCQWWTNLLGGVDNLRIIHNIAAWIMSIDLLVYHPIYILYGIFVKHKFPSAMIPRLKDLRDFFQSVLHILGLEKEPEYDHFQYGQKIDYWVIFWGMPVMCLTGLIMMFPAFFSKYLPDVVFPVSVAAHRDEALLAVGFILIVHLYYGHLASIAFPINWVFWTGRMTKEKYKQWFALEYRRLMREQQSDLGVKSEGVSQKENPGNLEGG